MTEPSIVRKQNPRDNFSFCDLVPVVLDIWLHLGGIHKRRPQVFCPFSLTV